MMDLAYRVIDAPKSTRPLVQGEHSSEERFGYGELRNGRANSAMSNTGSLSAPEQGKL